MRHHYLNDGLSGSHWGVSAGCDHQPLVQLQDEEGRQVRVKLTPEQARDMAQELVRQADLHSKAEALGDL